MLEKAPKKRPSAGEVTQLVRLMGPVQSQEQDTMIAPKKRRKREVGAEQSSTGKTEWIRPTVDRKPMTVQNRQRLWAVSAVLLFAAGWMTVRAVRSQQHPVAVVAAPTTEVAAGTTTAAVAPLGTLAPVSVSIRSVPSGAVVLDLEADKKLGVTPFSASMDARDKDLWLVLRKDGFAERVVRVSLRHSSEWSEKLMPESGAVVRPATRQSIEEMKKKYESSARPGRDPLRPRIVD